MDGFAFLRWRFSVCFLFALRRKARRVVLAQSCKSCSFFPLLFFPFRRLTGFSAERRWPSGQGPVAAAAPALAGWPAASARALCHRPAGSYGHRECRTGTGEATAHTDQAFCCDPPSFLADSEPLELQTVLLPHTAPEKPTCAVLLARKEHMQILQMSKYLNFKTNEG